MGLFKLICFDNAMQFENKPESVIGYIGSKIKKDMQYTVLKKYNLLSFAEREDTCKQSNRADRSGQRRELLLYCASSDSISEH